MQCCNLHTGLGKKTICVCPVLSVPLGRRFSLDNDARRIGDDEHFTSCTSFFILTTSCFTSTTSCFTSTTSRFTSPIVFDICCTARLVFSVPRRTSVQRDIGDQSITLHTIFDLRRNLQNLSHSHLKFFLYQAIEPFQCVLNICPPQ